MVQLCLSAMHFALNFCWHCTEPQATEYHKKYTQVYRNCESGLAIQIM